MTYLDVFDALLCALVVLVCFKFWKKFIKRPRVWVLDDSESDIALYKLKLKVDDCDVDYFTRADSIINEYIRAVALFRAPTCIVIDYYLSENVTGDEVLSYFRSQGVKCVIVTGHEGRISNIAERDIIHKKMDLTHLAKVENWIAHATGRA